MTVLEYAADQIGEETTQKAKICMLPLHQLPSAGKRRVRKATAPLHSATIAMPSERAVIDIGSIQQLIDLQSRRVSVVREINRLKNSARSHLARHMGFSPIADGKLRKFVRARSPKLMRQIEKRQVPADMMDVAEKAGPLVTIFFNSRVILEALLKDTERRMTKLAESLPIAASWKSLHGLGILGLATLIGESGDLSSYPTPGHLNSRFGVAPPWHYRSITKTGKPCMKKPRRRRSVLYNIGDPMIKARGDYRHIYDERKAYELARNPGLTKRHIDLRARRVMEKQILEDLWLSWRQAAQTPTGALPCSYTK